MSPASLVILLRALSIEPEVRNGRLVLRGPVSKLTAADRVAIRAARVALVAFLSPAVPSKELLVRARELRLGRPDLSRDELLDALAPPDQRREAEAALAQAETEAA